MEKDDFESKIISEIKKCLNETELEISLTPIMYKPNDYKPTIGVRVKKNDTWVKKYTIHITEDI